MLEALGFPVAALDQRSPALRFEADAAAAVSDADVVQENAPEQLDVKQQLWQTVERAAPAACSARVVFVEPSRLGDGPGDADARSPDRRPPVQPAAPRTPRRGGPVTRPRMLPSSTWQSRSTRPWASARRCWAGRSRASWPTGSRWRFFREAVHLVSQGIVSEQALDDVVTSSIGMRWAVAGPVPDVPPRRRPRRPPRLLRPPRSHGAGALVAARNARPRCKRRLICCPSRR